MYHAIVWKVPRRANCIYFAQHNAVSQRNPIKDFWSFFLFFFADVNKQETYIAAASGKQI